MAFSLNVTTAAEKNAACRAQLLAGLARVRWEHAVGGLTLPGGAKIRTDRETRAALTEAVNALANGLMQAPTTWKMDAGWTDLSREDLEAITTAVAGHVQTSLAAERAVQAQIDALSDTSGFDPQTAFNEALNAI